MSDLKEIKSLLESEPDHPEQLDLLWSAYIDTKNIQFVRKIISVLDWSDCVRTCMETWLRDTERPEYLRYQQRTIDWLFPIDYGDKKINGPLDLDIHVALLARDGRLKFEDLPISLTEEEMIRLAMKSAALWSLLSMSQQDSRVASVCKKEAFCKGGAARVLLENAGLSEAN
jgi:hypothetical protein